MSALHQEETYVLKVLDLRKRFLNYGRVCETRVGVDLLSEQSQLRDSLGTLYSSLRSATFSFIEAIGLTFQAFTQFALSCSAVPITIPMLQVGD